jgi:hypothetical protein
MNLPDSMAKNMPKIAAKLRTSEKIEIAELGRCGCEATFLKKVAELRLRTQKKIALAHLCVFPLVP